MICLVAQPQRETLDQDLVRRIGRELRSTPRWLADGYEVIVTADHGQTVRGHHGGHDEEMQDFALYYFGAARGPAADVLLDQLQLAPTILGRLGVPVPKTMKARPFLE